MRLCLYVLCGHLLGKADLLALVCGVLPKVYHFPIGILGQVWYLIVSIPDLCTLTYLEWSRHLEMTAGHNSMIILVAEYALCNIVLSRREKACYIISFICSLCLCSGFSSLRFHGLDCDL